MYRTIHVTSDGVCVESWVWVEGDCAVECDVVGGEAQLRFGGLRSTGLQMILDEKSLESLTDVSKDALDRMRSRQDETDGAPS